MMRSIEIVMLFRGGTWETKFFNVPATHFADDEMVREYLEEHERFADDVVGYYVWSRPNHEADDEDPRVAELRELEDEFEKAGGRGVELADRIDQLRAELGEDEFGGEDDEDDPQFDPRLAAALSRRALTENDWTEIVHAGGSLRDEIESEIGAVFNEDGEDIGRDDSADRPQFHPHGIDGGLGRPDALDAVDDNEGEDDNE
jgi:hypothetical protein